jgi:hypothetical protein
MEMTSARAKLVDADALDGQGVTATIPRDEIEAALAMEEPADLVLEVAPPAGEPRTVSVAWEPADLERLLDDTSGDAVTFSFRADELERAFEDPEFEGHGLRERALVLTVAAAAAAGAAAGVASATPTDEMGLTARGIQTTAVHDEAGLGQRGIEVQQTAGPESVIPYLSQGQGVDESQYSGTPQASDQAPVVPYLSQGQGVDPADFTGTPQASDQTPVVPYVSQGQGVDESLFSGADTEAAPVHDEAGLAARGIEVQQAAAIHDEAGLAARGIEVGPVHDEAGLAARGIDIDPTAVHDEATLVERGIEAPPAADTGGSGFEVPSVEPGTAAVIGAAGGVALLITAAGFAARRRGPIKPA